MAEYNFNSTFNPFASTQTQGSPLFNNGYNNSGVQLSALQRAMGNGGLNLNYAGTGWNTTSKPYSYGSYQQGVQSGGLRQGYSPADQRAADILNQAGPGPQTPLPKGGGYPGSQPSGGFLNWLNSLFSGGGSNTAAVGNATSTPGVTDNSADIIYPSFMAPPPKGSALNPAGSGDDENRPAPITSMTPSGSVGTTTITGAAGDKANAIQDSGTNQSDSDLLKSFLNQEQTRRDAEQAAIQTKIDQLSHDQTLSDQQKEAYRSSLMTQMQNSSQLSPEEQQTQAELDDLEGSKGKTVADLANQPISTSFITGQQAAVEKRVLAKEQPLQVQLSRLQASRQARNAASLDAAKLNYQSADEASKAVTDRRGKLENQLDEARKSGDTERQNVLEKYLQYSLDKNKSNNAPYTLSPGSTRYVDGKAVNSVPAKAPAPKTTPTTYNERSIPMKIKNDLQADIGKSDVTLDQIYQAYPEVSSTYIRTLYNSLHKSGNLQYGGK